MDGVSCRCVYDERGRLPDPDSQSVPGRSSSANSASEVDDIG